MRDDRKNDRENSFGGFQYRWNYDEYQKSLQRKRRRSAAHGMRAFCLTTAFVFILCFSSLVVVLTASFVRGALLGLQDKTVPSGVDGADYGLPIDDTHTQSLISPVTTERITEALPMGTDAAVSWREPGDGAEKTMQTEAFPNALLPNEIAEVDIVTEHDMDTETKQEMPALLSISEIAAACADSAVTIQCKNKEYQSIGSGFFLSADGYIVTNDHVIRRYDTYTVVLSDGETCQAELVASAAEQDLALLKIDINNASAVVIGDSADIAIGDQVVAIGTPGSVDFAGTVTYGYVSGLHRDIEITDIQDNVIGHIDMMQITAEINPGNSGGPLFNTYGAVVGINTMKMTGEGYEGMGFAIPIGDVIDTLEDWMETHRAASAPVESDEMDTAYTEEISRADTETVDIRVTETEPLLIETEPPVDTRPYAALGMYFEMVTAEEAALYRMPEGALIRYIEPDSSAETHGLKNGDVILSVNGTEITTSEALDAWASKLRVGDTAVFLVFRAGEEREIAVTFSDTASEIDAVPDDVLPAGEAVSAPAETAVLDNMYSTAA